MTRLWYKAQGCQAWLLCRHVPELSSGPRSRDLGTVVIICMHFCSACSLQTLPLMLQKEKEQAGMAEEGAGGRVREYACVCEYTCMHLCVCSESTGVGGYI